MSKKNEPVSRCCPSCARRFAGIVADDCILCRGTGMIELDPSAVHLHSADVVSLAVECALEVQARHDLGQAVQHFGRAREHQAATMATMRSVGLLPRRPGEAARQKLGIRTEKAVERMQRRPRGRPNECSDVDLWTCPDADHRPAPFAEGFTAGAFIHHLVLEADWARREDPAQHLLF